MSNENKQELAHSSVIVWAGCKRAKQIFAAATSQMSFSPKDRGRWRWGVVVALSPGFQKDLSSGGNGNNNFPALQEQDGSSV